MMKNCAAKFLTFLILLFALFAGAEAALFTSQDKAFTVDLPASWVKVNDASSVLSLKRAGATMKFKQIPNCHDIVCLENTVQDDLAAVKKKKFRILENTYSGDIIKRTEFSTGDPLFSFNFSGATVDFTTGYFLADGSAYSVAIKGLPYVEADLILSFISPAAKPTDPEEGASLDKALERPAITTASLEDVSINAGAKNIGGNLGNSEDESEVVIEEDDGPSLVSQSIKGPLTLKKIILLIVLLYGFIFLLSFAARLALPAPKTITIANPKSGYPIKGARLYGSPDLFFKAHDNQGNNYIATSARWGNLLMGFGIFGSLFFLFVKAAFAALAAKGMLHLHAVIINTILSLSSLLVVLSAVVFAAGFVLNMVFAYKFYIYDKSGQQAFKCVQKGWSLFKEDYIVADAASAVVFKLSRKRFSLAREWTISDAQGIIATIKENSKMRALARLLLGHLCGFLRSNYIVSGRFDSKGTIISYSNLFAYFKCELDKPSAIEAETLLATAAIIFLRDRDKWHPWVN
ncbi:MAG: LURP-one-related family protein [Elusimicrobiota bacterium]|jgi:hypothetical protein|nr:LURP-one-related family protein [Elusimicrobiota bacterium]